MHYKNTLRILLTTVIMALASMATASAANLQLPGTSLSIPTTVNHRAPTYYPETFQSMGRIQRINSSGNLRVSGSTRSYTLSLNVLVHSLSTEFSSRRELHTGTEIGFSFDTATNSVTEVWLLPPGSIAEH